MRRAFLAAAVLLLLAVAALAFWPDRSTVEPAAPAAPLAELPDAGPCDICKLHHKRLLERTD